MRLLGAAAALAIARVAALAGHDLVASWWSPVAYLWHDAVTLAVYATVDFALRSHRRLARTAYVIFMAYVALTVPVLRVLSTPMTLPMWRAARGPLVDSIARYVTVTNLAWVVAVLVAAVAFDRDRRTSIDEPRTTERRTSNRERRTAMLLALIALLAFMTGSAAGRRVDTRGLERNAWSAIASGVLPRLRAEAADADWRVPYRDRRPDHGLARFRGAAAGRNVVLVSLESTAVEYLGLYGAARDPMPNLSALAETGIVFENAYAVYPESIKGLFSILCSAYPAIDSNPEAYRDRPCLSLASLMRDAGYHAALFHSGRFGYLGMDAIVGNRGFERLADAGDIGGRKESSFGVDDGATVHAMLEWIDHLPQGKRFFVTYLPIAGHHPYDSPAPGPFSDRDELGRYLNALHHGDSVLGTLIDGLAARGLAQQTLWLVVGDHGEAFGQHDGNFGHTFALYEENVHVPFIISVGAPLRPTPTRKNRALGAPARERAVRALDSPVRTGRIVSLVDTAPTLLDLLGIETPASYQGRSAIDGEPRMALFFADYSLGLLGLRDGRFKYIYELESGRSRLFDIEADRGETRNLADVHAADARRYAQHLRAWSAAQKANLR